MKPIRSCLLAMLAAVCATSWFDTNLLAQNAPEQGNKQRPIYVQDGGSNQVLESIFIPPMANAPFTLSLHTEWIKYMADGGTMTDVNQRRIARQASGRFYQERWLLVPKNGSIKSRMSHIQIADPNAHTATTCFMATQVCRIMNYGGITTQVYVPAEQASGTLPDGAGTVTHEDLGKDIILGVETVGTRITTNINAMVAGNDRPFTITREFWFAPSLGINLISRFTDPRIGTQIFTVTELTPGEPDPVLFDLPKEFRVEDARAPAHN